LCRERVARGIEDEQKSLVPLVFFKHQSCSSGKPGRERIFSRSFSLRALSCGLSTNRLTWFLILFVVSACAEAQRSGSDAEAYFRRGVAYGKMERYEEAIADFSKALELSPAYSAAYYNRGTCHGRAGRYDEAIADFSKALDLDPKDADAYYNRGISYEKKGDHDQAVADFTKTLEVMPGHAGAYLNRAAVYLAKEDYEKAWDDVQRLRDLRHEVPPDFLKALREASGREK
jgi:tetratricopeptide (TPR) repeat protein